MFENSDFKTEYWNCYGSHEGFSIDKNHGPKYSSLQALRGLLLFVWVKNAGIINFENYSFILMSYLAEL